MLFLEDQIYYNYENFENSSNSTMPRPKENKKKRHNILYYFWVYLEV